MSRPNRFAGYCRICGENVAENTGLAEEINGKWKTRHMGCLPDTASAKAASAMTDDELAQELRDPFGKRAAPQAPENVPAFADYLASAERDEQALEGILGDLMAGVAEHVAVALDGRVAELTADVPRMVADVLATARRVEISIGEIPAVEFAKAHAKLPIILNAVVAGASPMLVGPAGSGKTTLAEQVAKALGRPFYMAARVTSDFKLMGYRTATGELVRTQFREAFEHGGVFLFDEIDASDADALIAFNAALSNGLGDFPDGMVRKHPDFVAIAAGNTFGRGADRQYVGRNQLDAATLDRFAVFEVDYDESLELAIAGDDAWTKWVQSIRAAIDREKVRHIVSPRASIMGARMLAQGMGRTEVEDAVVWKGLDAPTRQRVTLARRAPGSY